MAGRLPPPPPERRPPEIHQPPEPSLGRTLRSWTLALAVLFGALLILLVFARLMLAVLGVGFFPILFVMGLFLFIGFQYLLWGRWLGNMIRREEAARQKDE